MPLTIEYHSIKQTDTFAISNHDGKITVNGPLDFETEQRYTLFVTVKVFCLILRPYRFM